MKTEATTRTGMWAFLPTVVFFQDADDEGATRNNVAFLWLTLGFTVRFR